MATCTAIATGNWNTAGTWSGGVKPIFGNGDTVVLAGYQVTLDVDADIGSIDYSNNSSALLVTMNIHGSKTFTCANPIVAPASGNAFLVSGILANIFTLNCPSITGGSGFFGRGILTGSQITMIINADCYGGGNILASAVELGYDSVVTVTGNVYGGTGMFATGVAINAGTLVIAGDVVVQATTIGTTPIFNLGYVHLILANGVTIGNPAFAVSSISLSTGSTVAITDCTIIACEYGTIYIAVSTVTGTINTTNMIMTAGKTFPIAIYKEALTVSFEGGYYLEIDGKRFYQDRPRLVGRGYGRGVA
jgi:hypothetical protein